MDGIIGWIISLISGIIGGNLAGSAMKEQSLGALGNSLAGLVGGGLGGQLLSALGVLGGAGAHKRELTALSPCSTPSSCRLLLSVRACPGSMVQPSSHRGFLMPPTPSTTAEKAAQTGEARLESGLRPPALHLLPQRLQPQPAHQPTAHHDARG